MMTGHGELMNMDMIMDTNAYGEYAHAWAYECMGVLGWVHPRY